MSTSNPTPPASVPESTRTDSGEHAAADRATARIGKATFQWRWSGVARAVAIAAPTLVSLVVAFRAPTKGEVKAEVTKKAEDVLEATAKPIDNHADELTRTRAELARLATIVEFYEKERKTLAADPTQHTPKRQRRGKEIEKKLAAAATDIKLITARRYEPPPLSAPKALPGDAPKDQPPPQAQQGAGGATL